ncbi:MAG: hypothetical protein JWN34_102 [Bryobacterales bacterium]|nr:hypothetical protein [Bryobacterales bacterium]
MSKCNLQRILGLLPLFLLAACGGGPKPTETQVSLPAAHVDPATAGTISGRILFQGEAPAMPVIDMSSNPKCDAAHPAKFRAETVIVNANHTLRNVFIHIKDGLAPARWTPPSQPAKLNQDGCVYTPHVQGMMADQDLEILNSDPVNHNVHAECQKNQAWNESQPPRAEHKFKKFGTEEILFPVTCSVHPWMRAWIGVSSHPFFAVSGEDGSFKIEGVPPGSYTVEAIHEKLGRKEGKLTLAPSGAATLEFTYGS